MVGYILDIPPIGGSEAISNYQPDYIKDPPKDPPKMSWE